METGPVIPRAWVNELARLESLGLRGFIAGGAVRDMILRRPHKDVDIWLPHCYAATAEVQARAHGWRIVAEGGYVSSALEAVYEYESNGETINLIVTPLQSPEEVMGRFDFGICRAAIRRLPCPIGSGMFPVECVVVMTAEFLEDMQRKVFKVRHDNGAARTLARWHHFSERYPDWTFEP